MRLVSTDLTTTTAATSVKVGLNQFIHILTHQEHVPEIVDVAEELLRRDFFWVKDKVLSHVRVLLFHVFMQQVQLLVLLLSSSNETVKAAC